ncbi:MAG: HAD-IA family hydrolase [Brucellaceae bacterium]|nr:HAD-IA family hydrolase [Brucellaceae bacterium]
MPLEALVFDVDGTLAETEEIHRQAFNETFDVFGLGWHWSVDDYRVLLRTTGGKERIRAHGETLGAPLDDAFVRRLHAAKTERYGELIAAGAVALRPGIRELIEEAAARGLRLAVATTTNRPNVDALIRAACGCAADEMFEVIAAGDEVAAKKPAPDVYELALRRLGLPASHCVAFEDSANGLRSALGAGLQTVVSPSQYTSGEDFTGALMVVDDYRALSVRDVTDALLATA